MGYCMRFDDFLNELKSIYGKGITFIDIDNTLFKTFAKIKVIDDKSGKIIKELDNQEFNTFILPPDTHYDFAEFKNAELFNKTSIPIPKTIDRIKRMFVNISERKSKVVFLTARSNLDNKELFLETFRKYGIPIDNIYVERAGNLKGTVSSNKKVIVLKYIATGEYRRVRLIDDDMKNLKEFLKLQNTLPESLINKIKKKYNITEVETIPVVEFFALQALPNGSLRRVV